MSEGMGVEVGVNVTVGEGVLVGVNAGPVNDVSVRTGVGVAKGVSMGVEVGWPTGVCVGSSGSPGKMKASPEDTGRRATLRFGAFIPVDRLATKISSAESFRTIFPPIILIMTTRTACRNGDNPDLWVGKTLPPVDKI